MLRQSVPTIPPSPSESSVPSPSLPRANGFRSAEEFTAKVEPLLPELVRIARRFLHTDDLAQDAVQESLLRLWVAGWLPESPRSALQNLVAKSCLHQMRCLKRRREHESRAVVPEVECEDPLHRIQWKEEMAQVREAAQKLALEYRQVLDLFEFQGKSYEEIADRLGLPLGTVRSRLSRARTKLREHLCWASSAA